MARYMENTTKMGQSPPGSALLVLWGLPNPGHALNFLAIVLYQPPHPFCRHWFHCWVQVTALALVSTSSPMSFPPCPCLHLVVVWPSPFSMLSSSLSHLSFSSLSCPSPLFCLSFCFAPPPFHLVHLSLSLTPVSTLPASNP